MEKPCTCVQNGVLVWGVPHFDSQLRSHAYFGTEPRSGVERPHIFIQKSFFGVARLIFSHRIALWFGASLHIFTQNLVRVTRRLDPSCWTTASPSAMRLAALVPHPPVAAGSHGLSARGGVRKPFLTLTTFRARCCYPRRGLAARAFTACPTVPKFRMPSDCTRILLIRRLRLPLPHTPIRCPCGRTLATLGDHRVAPHNRRVGLAWCASRQSVS